MARRQIADPLEAYDTPEWVTRALILHGPIIGGRVIEPCAGRAAMSFVLLEDAGCEVTSYDIAPRHAGVVKADTLAAGFFETATATPDVSLITNPPFSLAAEYWRRGKAFRRVALLVRITWLERTKDRQDVEDPVRVIVLPRPKFVGKGSDSATCVWACWGDWKPGIVRLSHDDKKRLQAPRRAVA